MLPGITGVRKRTLQRERGSEAMVRHPMEAWTG
jgi:hypothetical protein